MTEIQMVALRDLRPGGDVGMNARITGRDVDIDALAQSIFIKGLISPLSVFYDSVKGCWFVIDGNRRLAALQLLYERDQITDDHLVPCVARDEDDAELFETSLIANIERVALHPVDEFAAFWSLTQRGMTPEEIASRQGVDIKLVRQRLALGALHHEILDAWRNDEIGATAAEAFTLADDTDAQLRVWHTIKSMPHWGVHTIRRLITGDSSGMADVAFVGEADYVAAGGRIREDLFGNDRFALDRDLLSGLVEAKLQAECGRLMEEGWKWATTEAAEPDCRGWAVKRVEPRYTKPETKRMEALTGDYSMAAHTERDGIKAAAQGRGYSLTDKGQLGVIVSVGLHGQPFRYAFGVYAPADAPEPEKPAAGAGLGLPEKAAKPAMPGPVYANLCRAQTQALAQLLLENPGCARAMLVATLLMPNFGSPLCIKAAGWSDLAPLITIDKLVKATFGETLAEVIKLTPEQMAVVEAAVIAQAIDATVEARTGWNGKGVSATATADAFTSLLGGPAGASGKGRISSDDLTRALHQFFDFGVHFDGQPKPAALADVADAMGWADDDPQLAKLRKAKKGEIVAEAVKLVANLGWLPKSIRIPGDW